MVYPIFPQPGLPEGDLTVSNKECVNVLRPSGSPITCRAVPPPLVPVGTLGPHGDPIGTLGPHGDPAATLGPHGNPMGTKGPDGVPKGTKGPYGVPKGPYGVGSPRYFPRNPKIMKNRLLSVSRDRFL